MREVIASVQKAAKDHKPGGVMEHMSKDFRDNHGNNRDTLKALLLREMLTNRSLGVYITTNEVAVKGPAATANLKIVVTGSSGWLPEHMDSIRAKLDFKEEEGKWRVHVAEWHLAGQTP